MIKSLSIIGLFLLVSSCETKIVEKKSMISEYKDCEGNIVSKANIDKHELYKGNCDYFFPQKTFSVNWNVKKKAEFSFSVISDWKFIDDGDEFLYNVHGNFDDEKAQVLFWRKQGESEDLNGLLIGTRSSLIEKHKNVSLLLESDKNNVFYLEYDIEFTTGKKARYLELITYEQGYLISVGYYFFTESEETHRRAFFDYLSNVLINKKGLLKKSDLLAIMPLDICSGETINEKAIEF
jgi:hypothetical protein